MLEHKMILSASGWRKIFAADKDENSFTKEIGDDNYALSVLAADAFFEYLSAESGKSRPVIAVATDTRPTGPSIAKAVLAALASRQAKINYTGVAAAPEIMAYAKSTDGFIYISASHNPVGHNGIKFGLSDGGVLSGEENLKVRSIFEKKIECVNNTKDFVKVYKKIDIKECLSAAVIKAQKEKSLAAYEKFSREVISGLTSSQSQKAYFASLGQLLKKNKITLCCDFNGSARTLCIDKKFFKECGIAFTAINDKPGKIVHAIIPEPENLVHVAGLVEETAAAKKGCGAKGRAPAILGYMPDCDGDRGNIVYWSERQGKAVILKAQEVFALSVYAELSFLRESNKDIKALKPAVCVNCPTSMRIEEIAEEFGAKVFRAEVGEANVVNLARQKRQEGYTVRILGEGSNGGTITYPASVRDPLNTVFAIVKLLASRPEESLDDILDSFPLYTTTGVSEKRAVLHIKTGDHALLKKRFQSLFEKSFSSDSEGLVKKYGITGWKSCITNGIKERKGVSDFEKSGKGGLKILFYENGSKEASSFIWMRGSGTEPVFRIMCDVKGKDSKKEKALLAWETKLLKEADAVK